jgi:hypothetical protein
VSKCESFDCFDFHYFYTIKHIWVGDFGAKILVNFLKIYSSSFRSAKFLMSQEYGQHNFKDNFFLVRPKTNLCVAFEPIC